MIIDIILQTGADEKAALARLAAMLNRPVVAHRVEASVLRVEFSDALWFVKSYSLNVRSGAGVQYPVISVITHNDPVEEIEREKDAFGEVWIRHKDGWSSARYLVKNAV